MPKGIPVPTLAIGEGAANAALPIAMLALHDPQMKEKLQQFQGYTIGKSEERHAAGASNKLKQVHIGKHHGRIAGNEYHLTAIRASRQVRDIYAVGD